MYIDIKGSLQFGWHGSQQIHPLLIYYHETNVFITKSNQVDFKILTVITKPQNAGKKPVVS